MIDFLNVEKSVRELKKQVTAGEIDKEAFEAKLLELVDVAEDGFYWMFGHKTERWYRHDGKQWIPDSPGELVMPISKAKNSSPNNPSSDPHDSPSQPQNPGEDWHTINITWFVISLVTLGLIFWIVFISSL
jgi:hypothetical protein